MACVRLLAKIHRQQAYDHESRIADTMIIEKQHHRARVVKGWAFMNLDEETVIKIQRFLETGNTDDLPERFKRPDYSIYISRA